MEFVETTLKFIAKSVRAYRNVAAYSGHTSFNSVAKLTTIEPLTIVSKDCVNLEYITDINKTALDMFAASYLQAVNLLTRVNSVEIIRVLDKLNPDRDSTGWLLAQDLEAGNESFRTLSIESYKHSLPIKGVSLEAGDGDLLKETTNLAVGKLIHVKIGYGRYKNTKVDGDGQEMEYEEQTMPINIRLAIRLVPNSTIRAILAPSSHDKSFLERFHAARAGRIDWIKDFVLARDLVDEYKKSSIEDDTGTIDEIYRRVANAKKFGLLTQNPSLATSSQIVIMSEEAAREVESQLGGRLSSASIRARAFENCYATTLCVVDRERERITFYSHGISAPMDLSVSQIKNMGSKKGLDIGDVLKSLTQGNSPF